MLDWIVTLAAAVAAALAILRTRRMARRLERLQESYWDLRYELGQLQARVGRLEPGGGRPAPPHEPSPAGTTAFVPLSSLKR
jgi:hypothetical protein